MMELQNKALPMFLLHIRGRQLPRGLICFFQSCVLKTNTRERERCVEEKGIVKKEKKHIARLRQDGLEKKKQSQDMSSVVQQRQEEYFTVCCASFGAC